jgi:hypothetical protein
MGFEELQPAADCLLKRQSHPLLKAESNAQGRCLAIYEFIWRNLNAQPNLGKPGLVLAVDGVTMVAAANGALLQARTYFVPKLLDRPVKFFSLAQPEVLLGLWKGGYFGVMPEAERLPAAGKWETLCHPRIVSQGLIVQRRLLDRISIATIEGRLSIGEPIA